ncbi:MAG: hypothetical protein ACMVY4_21525 [Minwuia sp.]|uniref:hypothetical protein n=1 Tax=Minwuia sp. TaxID=2493630 RepID=UPI003A87EEB9
MSSEPQSPTDPVSRALKALERVEKIRAGGLMRRTAAEPAGEADSVELESLRAENASLRAELAEAAEEKARLRREAAQLAVRVDSALEQLDLIEKG